LQTCVVSADCFGLLVMKSRNSLGKQGQQMLPCQINKTYQQSDLSREARAIMCKIHDLSSDNVALKCNSTNYFKVIVHMWLLRH
jgi:hypothetical protein